MGAGRGWVAGLALTMLGGSVVGALTAPPAASAAVTASVRTSSGNLNVRSGPSTSHSVVGKVSSGTALQVACQVNGQSIAGAVRTTSAWNRLTDGRYISDAYVVWPAGQQVGACGSGARAGVSSRLNLRSNTSTLLPRIGTVASGGGLNVTCQLGGENTTGTAGTTAIWDRLDNGAFVSDAYVAWPGGRPSVPWCAFTGNPAPAKGEPFIQWAAGHAQRMRATYRVPTSVIIAQAILESGWGGSGLTRDGNNYFGMKCFGTPGRIATGCRPYRTTECADANCYRTTATFRVYIDPAESFRDHSNQYATLPRYAPAFAHVNNPDQFAIAIHRAGYATSPTYAQNLINLMRQHNLYRFDAAL